MDISLEGAGPVLMTSRYKRPAASRVMLRVRLLREHSTECMYSLSVVQTGAGHFSCFGDI